MLALLAALNASRVAPWPSSPATDATANGDINAENGGPVYVGVQFNSSGIEYERHETSGAYTKSQGSWITGGTVAEIWVEFTRTAGAASWDGISNGVRYQLSTTRSFGIDDQSGTNSITGYFKFYDAASGGNTLETTSTVLWSATDTSI